MRKRCSRTDAGSSTGENARDLEVERALAEAYREWFAAAPRHDFGFFERTLAEEWTYTDIEGVVRGKREYIDLLRLVQPEHSSTLSELQARRYGGVALAIGHYAVRGILEGGKDVGSSTRFTSVWIRRKGRWQCIAHHATSLGDPG
jgi:ketosteroid isomerase-like protein